VYRISQLGPTFTGWQTHALFLSGNEILLEAKLHRQQPHKSTSTKQISENYAAGTKILNSSTESNNYENNVTMKQDNVYVTLTMTRGRVPTVAVKKQ
jgi:hypothetical protein